jgi:hypothetical protein
MKLKDIIRVAAPAIVGPMVGGLPFLSSIQNPFIRSALGTGIGSVAFGRKPKDALRDAVIGGLSGGIMEGIAAPGTEQTLGTSNIGGRSSKPGFTKETVESLRSGGGGAGSGTGRGIAAAIKGGAPDATGKLTMSGELLRSLNIAGPEEGNLLFKLLNTNLGEGIAAGLIAQLLAGDDEEPPVTGGSRPYGAGGPGGQIGGINYMKAGGEPDFFPRRNGGIDPAEGSGTKDDVPALLLAGEFVHTREANEGLGKMMGAKTKDEAARKGIQAQYQLMDAFERMA